MTDLVPADWITNARSLAQSSSIPLGVPVNIHMDMLLRDTRRDLRTACDALEAVLALHRPHICGEAWGTQGACFIGHGGCMSGGTCRECRMSYPCPTVAAVTGALS